MQGSNLCSFNNRVALVTGAAGNIGRTVSRLLKAHGVRVAGADIGGEGVDPMDVTDPASVRKAVADVIRDFGKIDIVVNNAGVWEHRDVKGRQRFEEMDPVEWKRLLTIDVDGVFHVTQATLPHLLANGYGRIVNLTSIAGEVGLPGYADYATAKAGIISLTRTLAMETAKRGVTVNSVAPGWIERTSRPIDRTWIGRCGEPKDIARAILFFADDEAGYITGTELPVDGGRILGSHGDDM